ncbi:adenylate kinase [Candidatus Saganbacteria bacterium]|nr:adenylate kinase [Candidatus Saganbacteria bacterium]
MILIFLGPPGSGKGTQAKRLADKMGFPHIALGDILRESIRLGDEVGLLAKGFVEAGKLVPDEVTIRITRERIAKPDCQRGFILDGFPRSLNQALALDETLKGADYRVVYFDVPLQAVIERNAGRWSCPNCGAVYHVKFNPPKQAGICDRCGEKLYQRKDDNEEVIKTRFVVYEQQTTPLIEYYSKKGKLVKLEAEATISEVNERLQKALGI